MPALPQEAPAAIKTGTGACATAPVSNVPVTHPGPGQILVKTNWTGLCASDKSLLRDEWSGFGLQQTEASKGIAGHEGAGVVVAAAEDVGDVWKVGDRAGVKWVVKKPPASPPPAPSKTYVLTSARYATRIPAGVADEEAGPIMCGGVTAYVALKRAAVRPGQWVVLFGAGGGLGHFGVQYAAKAMGMRVIAVDGGRLCREQGAEAYVGSTKVEDIPAEVVRITKYGAHGAVVYAASRESYAAAPKCLRPGGTMVAVGLSKETDVVAGAPPVMMAMKRLNVVGSVVGTLKGVEEYLEFTASGLAHPILNKGTLYDIDKFCDMMGAGKLPGRAVVKVGT